MLCDDGNLYVVKFQNNPQHERVLANEMLATRLAQLIGLTVPACAVIEVGSKLISSTSELVIDRDDGRTIPCKAGLSFGSLFVGSATPGLVVDYLPEPLLSEVKNLPEFAGMLAFDKWTGNADGRQAVYSKTSRRDESYLTTFIDQGYCFNAGLWNFDDSPIRGAFARTIVYESVTGWTSFEPWLGRIEALSEVSISYLASTFPSAWYSCDYEAFTRLLADLRLRQSLVRTLISAFRNSSWQPFPNWIEEDQNVTSVITTSAATNQATRVRNAQKYPIYYPVAKSRATRSSKRVDPPSCVLRSAYAEL
jgi:hypothetical protein